MSEEKKKTQQGLKKKSNLVTVLSEKRTCSNDYGAWGGGGILASV